jgi:formylglycine-generating enzyme required for sulfatase activity
VIRENQPKRDKDFFALLEELYDGRARHGEFNSRWLNLAPASAIEKEKKAPPRQEKVAHTPTPVIATPRQEEKAPPRMPVESFTDDLNGVPLEMIFVLGGSFRMGSAKGVWRYGEKPKHNVTVPDYFIGKYQITQSQWNAVMGENPSFYRGDSVLPVENVSWDDAK